MSTFYKYPHKRSSRHRHDHRRRVLSQTRKMSGMVAALCAPLSVVALVISFLVGAQSRQALWLWISIGYAAVTLGALVMFFVMGALRHRHDRHAPPSTDRVD